MANWTRKAHWAKGLFILAAMALVPPAIDGAGTTDIAPTIQTAEGERIPLVRADDYVALQYDSSVDRGQLYEFAKTDSRTLNAELLKTLGAGKQVLIKADRLSVERGLAARDELAKRIVRLDPVFFVNGKRNAENAVTMTGRVMIRFREPLGVDARAKFFESNGLTNPKRMLADLYSVEVGVSRAEIPAHANELAEKYADLIDWAEPSMYITVDVHSSTAEKRTDDPFIDLQWYLANNGENTWDGFGTVDVDLDVPRAWNSFIWSETSEAGSHSRPNWGQRNPPVVVAVFDTGTDLNHEDWKINTSDPRNLIPGTSPSDPVNQSVLDTRVGYDYIDNDPNPSAEFFTSVDAHGTSVAGIIAAAANNGKGVTGIAPAVKIYTARILAGDASATDEGIAQAIIDSANRQIDIGNHSWGMNDGRSVPVIDAALKFAWESGRFGLGMVHFASSGNDGRKQVGYPARSVYSISVGGVGDDGARVSYSNWGNELDFVGPTRSSFGTGIVTTDLSGPPGFAGADPLDAEDPLGNYTKDADEWFSGTSASCPAITGVGALILAVEPSLHVQDLLLLMAQTADRYGDPQSFVGAGDSTNNSHRGLDGFHSSSELGYGMPNPYNAMMKDHGKTYAPTPLRAEHWVVAYRSDFDAVVAALDEVVDEEFPGAGGSCNIDVIEDVFERMLCRREGDPEWYSYGLDIGGDPASGWPQELEEFPVYVPTKPDENSPDQGAEYVPVLASEGGPPIDQKYLLMSTRPTTDTQVDNPRFNPRGQYRANYLYVVENRETNAVDIRYSYRNCLPVLVELVIKHELGTQNASSNPGTVFDEQDVIQVFGDGQLIGQIIGDSRSGSKDDLEPAAGEVETDETNPANEKVTVAEWDQEVTPYRPQLSENNYFFRTYVFKMPREYMNDEKLDIRVAMATGPSYLPVYNDDTRVAGIRRDYRGFQLASIAVRQLDKPQLVAPNQARIARLGTQPVLDPPNVEEFYLDPDLQTVKVAPQLSMTEIAHVSGSTTILEEVSRVPIPIFQTDSQIFNIDSDYRTGRLLYTSNSPTGASRIHTVHPDGWDEKEIPTAVYPTFATFSQSTSRIYYTNGSQIRVIDRDGSNDTFLFDEKGTDHQIVPGEFADLSNFNHLTVDYSDGTIVFTALETVRDAAGNVLTNPDGSERRTINLYAAPTIANRPGEMAVKPKKLLDWPTWERNPKFSYKTNRLAFGSNALSYSNPDHTGTIKIYILENVEEVLADSRPAVITTLKLLRQRENSSDTNVEYRGADMPRWSTDGERIGLIGFLQEHLDSGQYLDGLGEVAWIAVNTCSGVIGSIAPPNPTPTPYPSPTVSPTPQPTATPADGNQVFSIGQYDFDATGDGWQFYTSASFAAPRARVGTSAGTSFLELTANNDSTNTFGFYSSPQRALDMFPFDPTQKPWPDYYLFRGYLRRTTDDATMAPGLRLRVNSRDFQHYATVESYSVGELYRVPEKDSLSALDLLFQPPRELYELASDFENYTMSFDLLNFMPEDDPDGGYRLERVDLFRITSGSTTNPIVLSSAKTRMGDSDIFPTAQQAEAEILALWESGGLPARHAVPELTFDTVALGPDSHRGRLSGRVITAEPASFGYWSTIPLMLSANVPSGGTNFLRLRTSVSSFTPNPATNPEIRFRISSSQFSTTVTQGIVPAGQTNLTPRAGKSVQHYTYFPIPDSASGDFPIMIGWDIMNFINWPDTNNDPVFLDSVELDVVQFSAYPVPATLP